MKFIRIMSRLVFFICRLIWPKARPPLAEDPPPPPPPPPNSRGRPHLSRPHLSCHSRCLSFFSYPLIVARNLADPAASPTPSGSGLTVGLSSHITRTKQQAYYFGSFPMVLRSPQFAGYAVGTNTPLVQNGSDFVCVCAACPVRHPSPHLFFTAHGAVSFRPLT